MSQDLDAILSLDGPIEFGFSFSQTSCTNNNSSQCSQNSSQGSKNKDPYYRVSEIVNIEDDKENVIPADNISTFSSPPQTSSACSPGSRIHINTQLLEYLNYTQNLSTSYNSKNNFPSSSNTFFNGTSNAIQFTNNFPDMSPQIPLSIQNLYKSITNTYSDASFVHAIAAQLCQNYLPMDCMSLLKTSLLLSLVSIGVSIQFR